MVRLPPMRSYRSSIIGSSCINEARQTDLFSKRTDTAAVRPFQHRILPFCDLCALSGSRHLFLPSLAERPISNRIHAHDRKRSNCQKACCGKLRSLCAHSRTLSRSPLLLLQRCQIVAQIPDPLLHRSFVLLVVIPEARTPSGHLRGTVRRRTRSKFKHTEHVFRREFSAVTPGQ